MAGPPVTSIDAFSFAAEFVEFERQRREENERLKNEVEKGKHGKAVSDPKEVIGTADYGKFTRLSKELEAEEEREEVRKKQEAAQANAMAVGCGHDHSKERQLFERPTLEKIQAADRFRREGNAAFKEQNFGLAAVNYRKALLQFDYTFPSTPEEEELFEKSKLPCHLNLAACKLQLRDFEEVYIQCRLALQLDPKNCKAFYRRGMAQMMQDHLDEAQQSFTSALEVEPSNPHVISALKELRIKKANYQKTSVDTYKKMFVTNPKQQKRQQNLDQPEQQQQQQTNSERSELPEAAAAPKEQGGVNKPEQQAEPTTNQQPSPQQQPDGAQKQQLHRQHEEQQGDEPQEQQPVHQQGQEPQSPELPSEKQMPAQAASAALVAVPAASQPLPCNAPPSSPSSCPAATAAVPDSMSDECCCCEGPCPCSGEVKAECSRGRGFDPHSAMRLIREDGDSRRQKWGCLGPPSRGTATTLAGIDVGGATLAVVAFCAASAMYFCSWKEKSLSPAAIAAVAAAAAAVQTAGPWVVGGALLMALLLGGWLLTGNSSEAGSTAFLCIDEEELCSSSHSPCKPHIQHNKLRQPT